MAIVLPERIKNPLDIPWPETDPAGGLVLPASVTSSQDIIPEIGTTNFFKITTTTIAKYNSVGTSLWSVAVSTYGMSALFGIAVQSGVMYVLGYHTTGTLIGWIEIDISTGSVTDNFTTETYATQPNYTYTSSVFVTATEITAYNNGQRYIFNRSTKAKTSETTFGYFGAVPYELDGSYTINVQANVSPMSITSALYGSYSPCQTFTETATFPFGTNSVCFCEYDDYLAYYAPAVSYRQKAFYHKKAEIVDYLNTFMSYVHGEV